jgi:hypothetical protein
MGIIEEFLSKINSQRVLVIAGSQKEFNTFVDMALDLFEKEGKYEGCEFVYYNNLDSVRGMKFDSYLYYGTGSWNSDLDPYLSYFKSEQFYKE